MNVWIQKNKVLAAGIMGAIVLLCCVIAVVDKSNDTPKVVPTVIVTRIPKPTNIPAPTITREVLRVELSPTPIPAKEISPVPSYTNTPEPTSTLTNTPAHVIPEVSKPKATGVPQADVIICKDGHVWPSKVRKGACHGHGGIRK